MLLRLVLLVCAPLCGPAALLLTASPSQPAEGDPMTLTCENWPPPQQSYVQPHFRFLREGRALGGGWRKSPQLEMATVWSEDSGAYSCEAQTGGRTVTKSRSLHIRVRRVPVSNVRLETQPPGGHVMKGEKLALVCLVTRGTGDITFLWYKGALGLNLEAKTQRSLTAKFEIPAVTESDAGRYYCAADNGSGPSISGLVSITVIIPVSRPVLTLRAPGAPAVPGDTVELRCEARRGSPPVLYRFYHEDVALGSSSAPSGGRASFNLSLTAEHSGNYSCEASNGLTAQRSEVVPLRVAVPTEDRKQLVSAITEGLLGMLALAAVAVLFSCWLKRKIGRRSARDPPRIPPRPGPRESTYLNSPAPQPLQPMYENVNVVRGDEVYSLAYSMQQEWRPAAESQRTGAQDPDSLVIYSGLKKASIPDADYEDAM